MSRITGFWKRHLRPAFLNTSRRLGGVPVPRGSTTAAEHFAQSKACQLIRLPSTLTGSIPPRTIIGRLEEIENTKAMIPAPSVRAQYERQLWGASRYEEDAFVAVLASGGVSHDSALIITPDERVLADASGITLHTDLPTNPLRLRYLPRPRRRAGCTAALSCAQPYNYYHWVMDTLPRIALYENTGVHVDRFYAPVQHRFQRQSLALLGIGPDRIEPATANRHIVADRLAASSLRPDATRWKTDFLHRRLTGSMDAGKPPTRRVFISRRRRGKRILANDNAVFDALKPLCFRRYDLEMMTVAEQVRLFFEAECVVGPHGAGMTNTVFCRAGTKVVEINTPYRTIACFYDIAHHRQLDYRLYIASPICDHFFHFDSKCGVGDSDMWIDPLSFAESMAEFLDDRPSQAAPLRRAA